MDSSHPRQQLPSRADDRTIPHSLRHSLQDGPDRAEARIFRPLASEPFHAATLQFRADSDKPDDTQTRTRDIQPGSADRLAMAHQQQGMVLRLAIVGMLLVIAVKASVVPKHAPADLVIGPPVRITFNALEKKLQRYSPSPQSLGSFGLTASASLTIFSTALRRSPESGCRGMRTRSLVSIACTSASLMFCTR